MRVIFATGFRPFFFLAAIFALAWVPLWLLVIYGKLALVPAAGASIWHAHEMVFGYTTAVVAGFLLTAVRNWTSRPTASGGWLAALVVLWIAGRAVMLMGSILPVWLVASIDLAFLPALALAIARPILATRNKRNYGFAPLLVALALINVLVHLETAKVFNGVATVALRVAVDLMVLIIAIVGGRIIPLFTKNALDVKVRARDWSDNLALWTVALVPLWRVLAALAGSSQLLALGALFAAMATAVRARGWGFSAALKTPLLAVLHLGHFFIPLGLLLVAVSSFGAPLPESAGLHLLTYGSIGVLTLGMISRVALGHTGRPLQVHPLMAAGYYGLALGALVRTVPQLGDANLYLKLLWVSGLLWCLSFAIYLLLFTRILWTPRPDGKPG